MDIEELKEQAIEWIKDYCQRTSADPTKVRVRFQYRDFREIGGFRYIPCVVGAEIWEE